uniref:Uncharacterized protein n=1 Tax=Sinocyclocheilus rhinocerous TaxID=307959 RepID=A0A673FKN1_9TELE
MVILNDVVLIFCLACFLCMLYFLLILLLWAKHCVDGYDNSKHPMGSTWTKGRCIRCICSLGQMDFNRNDI